MLAMAFAAYDSKEGEREGRARLRHALGLLPDARASGYALAYDEAFIFYVAGTTGRSELRRDDPLDRRRWQFGQRREHVCAVAGVAS